VEYLEFKFKVSPLQPWKDILEAELGEVGFESFADTENGVDAYVQVENFDEEAFNNMDVLNNGLCEIDFEKNKVIPKNWNEEWEKNFSPINVDNRCVIRAPFHDATNADYEIIIEPGKAIAANTAVLLTQVEYLKHGDEKNFAIVDTAMNDLIRPALYQAWHEIIPVAESKGEVEQTYDIVGPICESADFLGKDRKLNIDQGDLLAVRSVGAYGFTMSSNYNSRPRAVELLVDGDKVTVIRDRETIENLFENEYLIN